MTSDEISLNNRNTGWSKSFTYIYSKHQTILFIRLTKDSCTDVAISHSFSVQKMSDEKKYIREGYIIAGRQIVYCSLSFKSESNWFEWRIQRKILRVIPKKNIYDWVWILFIINFHIPGNNFFNIIFLSSYSKDSLLQMIFKNINKVHVMWNVCYNILMVHWGLLMNKFTSHYIYQLKKIPRLMWVLFKFNLKTHILYQQQV